VELAGTTGRSRTCFSRKSARHGVSVMPARSRACRGCRTRLAPPTVDNLIVGAIANAASLSAGLTETWLAGSSAWVWQLGAAARNGVLAARLAAEGARGAPSALEGDAGLAAAFSDRDLWVSPADWALGQRWRTVEVIYDLAVDVRNDLRSRHNCLLRRSGRDDPAISKYFDLFPNFKSVHQEHNPGASVKGRKHRPIHKIGSPRNRIDPIRRRHG
jgi:MmgE/PrpD N-terminal domain